MFGRVFLSHGVKESEGRVTLWGPIIEYQVPFLPTTGHFKVYAGLFEQESKEEYLVEVELETPSKKIEKLVEGKLENNSAKSIKGFIEIHLDIERIILQEEGIHRVVLLVDGQNIDEYKFSVYNQNIEITR